ncbi:hypothetical protein AB0395_39655 [Streptosporangium sp. NPDC051023]|uniref:hypothetical protein n=1 Tax=Streptosporangium sp. NPDC051023 TaxID=3155410 RepID=UPI00344EA390
MTAPALIVLRPGDKVLATFAQELSDEETQAIASTLRRSFPGVTFTVMSGVTTICVQS